MNDVTKREKQIAPLRNWNLKRSSQHWSKEAWEKYLSSQDVPLREVLTRKYDDLADNLEAPDHHELILSELTSKRLDDALGALSPKQRQVVEAKYWEGLSEHEIAARYGISRSTVQMHFSRAISRLKRLMSSKFPLSEGTKTHSPHNACPARTETEGKRDE